MADSTVTSEESFSTLLVQHVFPGGGGSRLEKLVKNLPKNAIRPVVLAGSEGNERNSPELFTELGLPADLLVEHVRTRGPTFFHSRYHARGPAAKRYTLYKILSLPERSIYVPDFMVRWTGRGKRAAERMVEEQNIKCVFTTSPRESSHLIGLSLKEKLNLPWIADFRDLWTHKSLAYRPATPLHDWYIRRLEKKIMQSADHVLANTAENRDIYIRDFGLSPDKVTHVPNGFDRDDVDLSKAWKFEGRKFRVGHMGSLTKTSYPWKEFLTAFARLGDEVGRENIEFVHCGNHTNDVTDFVSQKGLESIFSYHGRKTHFEAMQLMAGTNVQLVLLYDNDDSYTLAPQKLYNYMILPGPILSIAPASGAVSRVTKETNCGAIVAPGLGDDALYTQLKAYYDDWSEGRLQVNVNAENVENYSRAKQAETIASIMRSIV